MASIALARESGETQKVRVCNAKRFLVFYGAPWQLVVQRRTILLNWLASIVNCSTLNIWGLVLWPVGGCTVVTPYLRYGCLLGVVVVVVVVV